MELTTLTPPEDPISFPGAVKHFMENGPLGAPAPLADVKSFLLDSPEQKLAYRKELESYGYVLKG